MTRTSITELAESYIKYKEKGEYIRWDDFFEDNNINEDEQSNALVNSICRTCAELRLDLFTL